MRELAEKTIQIRYQFLVVELQTCFTSLEMARFELSVDNMPVAKREIAAVEKGLEVLKRFSAEMPPEQKQEMEAKMAELQAAYSVVKQQVDGS